MIGSFLALLKQLQDIETRADVVADDGSLFGLGEMCERECWGRDEREGYFGLKGSFMANVDRNLFGELRWKKPKFLWLLV